MNVLDTLKELAVTSGFAGFFADGGWKYLIMIIIACVLLYLGIGRKFEPLLLVGIAFGALLTNIPGAGLYHMAMWDAYVQDCPYDAANDIALYTEADDGVVILDEAAYLAMYPDLENEILAPRDGTVAQVIVSKGSHVETGSPLIVLA